MWLDSLVLYKELPSREKTWQILEEVERVAREGERSVAQVAIGWKCFVTVKSLNIITIIINIIIIVIIVILFIINIIIVVTNIIIPIIISRDKYSIQHARQIKKILKELRD